jgi:hypothetical protein
MDERLQIIFSRRSIRKYTDQPVSEADITSLVQAGMARHRGEIGGRTIFVRNTTKPQNKS